MVLYDPGNKYWHHAQGDRIGNQSDQGLETKEMGRPLKRSHHKQAQKASKEVM